MLSFEEFHKLKSRERANATKEKTSGSRLNTSSDLSTQEQSPTKPNQRSILGTYIESQTFQLLTLSILIIDLVANFNFFFLQYLSFSKYSPSVKFLFQFIDASSQKYLIDLCNLISDGASVYYMTELFMIYLVFGFAVLGHVGYMLDTLILVLQLVSQNIVWKFFKILNLLRLWRAVRLLYQLIDIEKEKYDILRQEIEEYQTIEQTLKQSVQKLSNELQLEKEERKSISNVLQNYRDEIDTLNEALKIAAMDIAEIAQADDNLDSEDEQDVDSISQVNEVFKDTNMDKFINLVSEPSSNNTTKIIVNKDGTYTKQS